MDGGTMKLNILITKCNERRWVRDEPGEEVQFVLDQAQATNFSTLKEALQSAQGIEDSEQSHKWEVVMDDVFTIRAQVNAQIPRRMLRYIDKL
jgi:hypothetical protein